ncbi:hypothetical protein FSW04_17895 [Baekduia soli]|uniref:Uncharacterized protein n=1 Tax=Baekduia soli TaxID=496014 RepID=A0A5B8U8H7_9ACTN|nr:hypothetical protein [Baekduia soli]QEC49265.1 hypothetical protein FSW04_17895 [Baekduia soli]
MTNHAALLAIVDQEVTSRIEDPHPERLVEALHLRAALAADARPLPPVAAATLRRVLDEEGALSALAAAEAREAAAAQLRSA